MLFERAHRISTKKNKREMSIRDMNFFALCTVYHCTVYSRCTFVRHTKRIYSIIKIFLQWLVNAAITFFSPVKWKKQQQQKNVFSLLPFILFVFQTYFSISVDFSLPYTLCGSGNQSTKKKLQKNGFH